MTRLGCMIACALFIVDSSVLGAETNYKYELFIGINEEGGNLELSVSYVNRSNHAYCVRYTDWEGVGLLLSLQLFDDKGKRLGFSGLISPPSFKTGDYSAFFVVPPGEKIRNYVNLNKVYGISKNDVKTLDVKFLMPFVRCDVFEHGYIKMPAAMDFDDDVIFSKLQVRELTEGSRDIFREWYRNGYLAFSEMTWIAQ